jgi:ketosteroid isomerase-like protein
MEPTHELHQLLDRQAIEDVLFRYCRGVDRGDAALIASAYHSDAVDEHGARTFAGEGIGHGIIDMTASQRITFHSITNMTVAFHEPDAAGCESYYHAWQTMEIDGRERILAAVGRYLDRFERRNGQWRIAHRLVVVDLATFLPETDFMPAAPDRGQRGPDDPSFALLRGR